MSQWNPLVHAPRSVADIEGDAAIIKQWLFSKDHPVTAQVRRAALALANEAESLKLRVSRLETDLEIAQTDLRMVGAVLTKAEIPERNEEADATIHVAYRVQMLVDRDAAPCPHCDFFR